MLTFGSSVPSVQATGGGVPLSFGSSNGFAPGSFVDPFAASAGAWSFGTPVAGAGGARNTGTAQTVNVDGNSGWLQGLSNMAGAVLQNMGARSDAPAQVQPAMFGASSRSSAGIDPMTLGVLLVAGVGVYLVATA